MLLFRVKKKEHCESEMIEQIRTGATVHFPLHLRNYIEYYK